jgi:ABC-type transport system involved in multi-copper enzyme maturation permease subunit
MLSAREVAIVAQREIWRNIRSAKGVAMFALFFMGGLLPAVIGMALGHTLDGLEDNELAIKAYRGALAGYYHSEAAADHLLKAPRVILGLFEGTLRFMPLLVLLIGFDQIAGEIQHRTVRYSAGRATRASIVAGKALGVWAVIAVMMSVLHLTVWVIAIARGAKGGPIVTWGAELLLFSIFASAAYVGFSSLVSSLFRTPIVALLTGAGAGFTLWLVYTVLGLVVAAREMVQEAAKTDPAAATWVPAWLAKASEAGQWIFPNRYEQLLVRPDAATVIGGIVLFLVWGSACVAGSAVIVQRRDI